MPMPDVPMPDGIRPIEYPDTAGYPDGMGFLDEGTTRRADESNLDSLVRVDRPSSESEIEVEFARLEDQHRFVAEIGNRDVGEIRYDVRDGRIVLLSTTVQPSLRDRGLGAALIADALDNIRDEGQMVTVLCPTVAAFITRNPDYADLVDPVHPGIKG